MIAPFGCEPVMAKTGRAPTVRFNVYPTPQGQGAVLIDVREGRRPAGMIELSATGWGQVRLCLTSGLGVRVVEYRPKPGHWVNSN